MKTIPKTEIQWVSHFDKDGALRYLTTSDPMRTKYSLWEVSLDGVRRLGYGPDPAELERRHIPQPRV